MKTQQILCAAVFWCSTTNCLAHELPDNRLTLVMRESHHVTMTFYINYIDALHDALSPKSSEQEFMLAYSTMTPQAFQKELQRAQAQFQTATKITLRSGKEATISNWAWPDAARVQAQLQERVVQALVAPTAHIHTAPSEVRAEIKSNNAMDAIKLHLPEEFQPVTVVSYRPSQIMIKPKAPALWIKFAAAQP